MPDRRLRVVVGTEVKNLYARAVTLLSEEQIQGQRPQEPFAIHAEHRKQGRGQDGAVTQRMFNQDGIAVTAGRHNLPAFRQLSEMRAAADCVGELRRTSCVGMAKERVVQRGDLPGFLGVAACPLCGRNVTAQVAEDTGGCFIVVCVQHQHDSTAAHEVAPGLMVFAKVSLGIIIGLSADDHQIILRKASRKPCQVVDGEMFHLEYFLQFLGFQPIGGVVIRMQNCDLRRETNRLHNHEGN